ncbi:MAG: hypothetical protein WCK65_13120 [Rhodospirillaceae bacterium]
MMPARATTTSSGTTFATARTTGTGQGENRKPRYTLVPNTPSADPVPAVRPGSTIAARDDRQVFNLPVDRAKPESRTEFFMADQELEGSVTEVGEETFTALLSDKTRGRAGIREMAEIPICEVDKVDMDLLAVGAMFYLTIGRRNLSKGRVELTRNLVFRRMPVWSRTTLERAAKKARELESYFVG